MDHRGSSAWRATRVSPYRDNPPKTYWKSALVGREVQDLEDVYDKKFDIGQEDRIFTAGSCFAQHIARYMRNRGFTVIDAEPAPPGIGDSTAHQFGYGIYSARFGNIYYVRQLLQLVKEAFGLREPQDYIWRRDDRFVDALRPSVEPNGFSSVDELVAHRLGHLAYVRKALMNASVFVYTLGLTEGWVARDTGTVYPTAPGTVAGSFDSDKHQFLGFRYHDIYQDFVELRRILRSRNPRLKYLLTVSPVPLAATATGQHVLTSTTYSKSTLRAVAGDLANDFDDVAYFPSFEIVTGVLSGRPFFDDSLRSVTPEGVQIVMDHFFSVHESPESEARPGHTSETASEAEALFCEEVLLEAFSK